jgi:hypothetical protein
MSSKYNGAGADGALSAYSSADKSAGSGGAPRKGLIRGNKKEGNMGIYISGMDMPEFNKYIIIRPNGQVHVFGGGWENPIAQAVELPPHGRLLVLPEVVYQHDAERIYESSIRRVIYETDTGCAFDDRAVGETVFLTREEAEAALRRGADG